MAIEVKMPQLGESVHEGTIGRWLKSEGEQVEKYEPLLEVITDKVDTEVTAVESGTLLQIRVPEGETVKVGTVLAVIGAPGEDVGDTGGRDREPATTAEATASGAESGAGTTGAPSTVAAPTVGGGTAGTGVTAVPRVSPVAARIIEEQGLSAEAIEGTGPSGQITRQDVERFMEGGGGRDAAGARERAGAADGDRAGAGTPTAIDGSRGGNGAGRSGDALGFISPRVARLAASNGVDLRRVTGTGKDGRITARDVERYLERYPAGSPAAASAAGGARAAEKPAVSLGDLVPLTPVRRAIADHMVRSVGTSPHVTTVHEVDMSAVVAAYRAQRDAFEAKGTRLTYTAFIVQAVAGALTEHPLANSSWTENGIQTHRDVNIGVAVAAPQGLLVPVIRNADEKSLLGIARDLVDLAERARSRQLSPDEVQGGTFTITNYGVFGSLIGTPIINQPQAAILGTGAIRKQPVVIEGSDGDSIAIRPMMLLALTFDHRILDGATADPFVQGIVDRLESVDH